ncbi:Ig-like domain-containing protein [Pseudomonas sp. B21-054]|uniref:Ig-like domain-containing protein n=1 Tax=Pseudomonas sp. B21-054 TaxID=2895494 RepID=UPI00222F9D00|nr:Ig-like domain-containing protein [Pseudomonas sp. B21-054]UZE19505.1 Ig-like domain-containing protein [Pseudomonas sp. B21-054]
MDIKSSALDELFNLIPVIVPGWITPVKPANLADGGIPKSLYDDQPRGLECLIDPFREMQRHSWPLEAWDRVDLYVNDNPVPVAGDTVQPGEEGNRMPLYIPHGRLIHGVNRLYYIVTRPSDNSSRPSRDLFVLYHLRAPGEPAPEGLDLVIPPDVVRDGVSAERAAQGVEFGFTYSHQRNYDRIEFLLGEITVPVDVIDASTPVVKTLFTETFQQAGDNANTLIQYRVTDQLGNSNQSPTKRLDIHLGRAQLPKPIPREVLSEAGDDPSVIDLGKLGANPLSLIILTDAPDFMPGDMITATYLTKVTGQPDDSFPVTGTVEVDGVGQKIPCVVEVPNHKVIPDSTVLVSYILSRSGTTVGESKTATATVTNASDEHLPIDQSLMELNGVEVFLAEHITDPWTQTSNYGPENQRRRTPDGGSAPFEYSSADNTIATVSADGLVTGLRNGRTLITVIDAHKKWASYEVQVSNKYEIESRSGYATGVVLYTWSLDQLNPVVPRPSEITGLREAILRRFPNKNEYLYPIWNTANQLIYTAGRVSGHDPFPHNVGTLTVHFVTAENILGVATRTVFELGNAAGWGFRLRNAPQLDAATAELYSELVEASADLAVVTENQER